MAGAATELIAEASRWTRRVVNASPCPDWVSLEPRSRAWILLDGAHSDTLENDLLQIKRGFEYRWVWRDTPREYRNPGYRHGPLLAPLDEALFTYAVEHWLRQQAGIILVAAGDIYPLVAHLQQLHQLVGTDGFPIRFSVNGARTLEEFCEGLTAPSLSRLFGPIQRLIWYAGNEPQGEWLVADSPVQGQAAPARDEPIALTKADEVSLDQARLAWFVRDCVRSIRRQTPAYDDPEHEPALWRRTHLFVREAADQLALTLERDVRHYVDLRFRYPQDFFAKDSVLRDILSERHIPGKQRLMDAEARLSALAAQ
ncbi:DUF4123 domain-containing protein [Achromobacter animicus]|uniref:DUF4123 domain-containing protein n=1 Tax=Achromobacter animicus TaxID=1389935 RepID=UPI001466E6D4|nr:DUF4123 domain-containing protein [Achromobacter animicus]CAB3827196.1 hypothetical protein LMG26691_00798 [Achromobacter animicus]